MKLKAAFEREKGGGAHGGWGAEGSTLTLGSVAEYIVHNAPCDVLLVREQGDREGSKEG